MRAHTDVLAACPQKAPRGRRVACAEAASRTDERGRVLDAVGVLGRVLQGKGTTVSEPDVTPEVSRGSIPGERGVALVARTVSLQAKVQNAFAIGVLLLLGGGFLTWYYLGLAESHDEAARRKPPAVQGEMLLPPLAPGPAKVRPVDDRATANALVDADSEAGRALLAAPVATPSAGMVRVGQCGARRGSGGAAADHGAGAGARQWRVCGGCRRV